MITLDFSDRKYQPPINLLRESPQLHRYLPGSYLPGGYLNITYFCLASDQADRQGPWAFCYSLFRLFLY